MVSAIKNTQYLNKKIEVSGKILAGTTAVKVREWLSEKVT